MSKVLFAFLFLPLFFLNWLGEKSVFNRMASVNKYVALGRYYYTIGNNQQALRCYSFVYDSLRYEDEPITLNYAQILLKSGFKRKSGVLLNGLIRSSSNASIRSDAFLNLGLLFRNDAKRCLEYFRLSLIENPANEIARYNYELMLSLSFDAGGVASVAKKSISSKRPTPKGGSSPVQNRAAGGAGPLKEGFQERFPQAPEIESIRNKSIADDQGFKRKNEEDAPEKNVINKSNLRDLNLTQEQALQILNAMQLEEVQYLQQQRKRFKGSRLQGPKW